MRVAGALVPVLLVALLVPAAIVVHATRHTAKATTYERATIPKSHDIRPPGMTIAHIPVHLISYPTSP